MSISPGEILNEEFLVPSGMTPEQLAQKCNCPTYLINVVLEGSKEIDDSTARILARGLKTSSALWKNIQTNYNKALV